MEAAKRVPLAVIRITPPTVLKIESCLVRIICTCITNVHIILIFNNLWGENTGRTVELCNSWQNLHKYYPIMWVRVIPRTVLMFEKLF